MYFRTIDSKSHFTSPTMSPPASTFPISNYRTLPLPSPLISSNLNHYSGSTLPAISTPQQYHSNSNDHPQHPGSHQYYYPQSPNSLSDSYFPPTPESRRSIRADSKPSLHSISSILSSSGTLDTQSESSSSSSSPIYYQNCYWSTSPTATSATTPRTSSVASTPLSGFGPGSVDYTDPVSYVTRDYIDIKEEDGGKRKIRRLVGLNKTSAYIGTYYCAAHHGP